MSEINQPMANALDRCGYSIRGLANWVLDYADEMGVGITNMALNKLLYFAVESALLKRSALLTNAKIEAWEHGPVFREVYQSFKLYGDRPISGRASFFSTLSGEVEESRVKLTPDDDKAMREALSLLIRKSASELRARSHVVNGAWHRVWWYDGHANPGMEISPDSIIEASTRGELDAEDCPAAG